MILTPFDFQRFTDRSLWLARAREWLAYAAKCEASSQLAEAADALQWAINCEHLARYGKHLKDKHYE